MLQRLALSLALVGSLLHDTHGSLPCIPKSFGYSSVVCVCNATYCDNLDPLGEVAVGEAFVAVSSRDGYRFNTSWQSLLPGPSEWEAEVELAIHREQAFQSMIGFGGAFTDASGINIAEFSPSLQDEILQQLYGPSGLEYNLGRVPMGGTDFSVRTYTYADQPDDSNLENFSLAEEDLLHKIPHIQRAKELNPNLKLFASVWSAPTWMKTNNDFIGLGQLKEEYQQTWVEYFLKFLDEYAKHDLTFWALTTQNEPMHGIVYDQGFNCMGWTAEQQRLWIKSHLGPTLTASNHSSVKLIMHDDQRWHLENYTQTILTDPEAAQYISGIGLHWYTDLFIPPSVIEETHNNFPDYFILGTEACAGAIPDQLHDVALGSWERAVNYASDIIQDINHFVGGWTDWNFVLDMQGGPNWANNFVDAPMIRDNETDNVLYKQPTFYVLGHFSKFIPEGTIRIQHSLSSPTGPVSGLEVFSGIRPDNSVTVVLLNRVASVRNVRVTDGELGVIEVALEPHSITTIVYHADQ